MGRVEWAYYGWVALHWAANRLPEWVARVLAWGAAELTLRLSAGRRDDISDNMRHVLGVDATEREVRAAARGALQHSLVNYYHLLRPLWSDEVWVRRHRVSGWEHFDTALAKGRGVILVSPHFGASEHILELFWRNRGIRIVGPVERMKPERLHRWFERLRTERGARPVAVEEAPREMLRTLRAGGVVGVAADLDITRSGRAVRFFDAPALLPQGPARLALRTGAAIVPVFMLRDERGDFRATIEPPLAPAATGDRDADVDAVTQELATVLERWIGRYPGQWIMFHSIWRWAAERDVAKPTDGT